MTRKYNPAAVGAFVVGAALLAVFAVVFFGGGKLFRSTTTHVAYFPGSIKGLDVGAPVTFRGVRIGSVIDIQAVFDIDHNTIYLPVIFELEDGRLQTIGDRAKLKVDPDDPEAAMGYLISLGLRARLELRSLVTGQLNVEMDMFPDSPVNLLGLQSPYREIPTLPTSIEQLKERIEKFFDKLDQFPLGDVGEDLAKALAGIDRLINSDRTRNIMAGVDAFVNAPELRQSVANLERALGSFDAAMRSTKSLADNAEGRIEPMYEGFMGATRGLEQALSDTRDLMESAKGAISEDSELRERSNRVMEELEAAATAVRILADYLERHPEALIKGKSKFGDDR